MLDKARPASGAVRSNCAGNAARAHPLADLPPAGEVTVAVYSPRLETNIGYAMVPIGNAALDTRLDIAAPWGPVTGIVSSLPFIKRR